VHQATEDRLNDAQREADTAALGTVLMHRVAWLIQVEQVAPWSLPAVSLT
jgi:superfamily I DNA/RNA helicase